MPAPTPARLLTFQDREALKRLTNSKRADARIGTRALILLNLDRGMAVDATAGFLNVTSRTVLNVRKRYETHGLDGLDDASPPSRPGRLGATRERELGQHFEAHPPATAAAADYIRTIFGVSYSVSGANRLLHRLALRWRRP